MWHRPVIIACMLKWVFKVQTETNEITMPPLRRLQLYCTLQSILRYHYTNARTSHTSAAAAPSLTPRCTHSSYRTHAAPRTTPPAQPPALGINPHQPAESILNRWVRDWCRRRPKVQLLYLRSPYGNAATAAIQRDAVSTAVLHQHEAASAPAAAATCMRCLKDVARVDFVVPNHCAYLAW